MLKKRKPILCFLMTVVMLLVTIPTTTISASAADVTTGDFTFDASTGKLTIITADGMILAGSKDWQSNRISKTDIRILEIASGIYTINGSDYRDNAEFKDCINLTSVILNDVTAIGPNVFYGCTSLVNIDLSNVTSIEGSAFYNCAALTSVDVRSATSIGLTAFYGCTSITSIVMPGNIKVASVVNNVNYGTASIRPRSISTLAITATANSDQPFTEWITPSIGTISDVSNTNTTYTIGASNVILAAIFGTLSDPAIALGAQSGALTYGTAGNATYAVVASDFYEPVFAPSVQWYDRTDKIATPIGITTSWNEEKTQLTINSTSSVNAGTYTFKVVSGTTESVAGSFVVGKKDITLIADSKSIFVGANEPTYTYTVIGLAGSDTKEAVITTAPTMSVAGFSSTAAATFDVVISGGATTNTNYNISMRTNGILTISNETETSVDKAVETGDDTPVAWLFIVALASGGICALLGKKKMIKS